MNIDFKTILKKHIQANDIQPRRAQVYVGFLCHQGCGFCYYKHRCTEKMFDISKIKALIDFEYAYGIRDFELTGGEPAEHSLLKEVCEYIKHKDRKSKIAVITNGSLHAIDIWNLIDEVLVSYHISKRLVEYDKHMFPKGSTWNKVKKTIDKAKTHNVIVRTNTVVGTFNMNFLQDIVSDLIELHPQIVNFLPVNIFDQAADMACYIDYNLLRPLLKKSIDILKQNMPDSEVYIRYMPFCDMAGYEQHILGLILHIYDYFDWNRELDGTQVIKFADSPELHLKKLGKYGSTSLDAALQIRNAFYIKTRDCMACKYFLICDGVEKTADSSIAKFIKPMPGKIVVDPLQYFKPNINLYNLLYAAKV